MTANQQLHLPRRLLLLLPLRLRLRLRLPLRLRLLLPQPMQGLKPPTCDNCRTSQCTPTLQLGARRRCKHTRLDTNVGPASLAKRTQPTGTVRPQGLEQQPRSARKREKLKTHAVLQDGWRREPLKHVLGAASASSAGKACNPQAWRPKHCK